MKILLGDIRPNFTMIIIIFFKHHYLLVLDIFRFPKPSTGVYKR